MASSILSKLKGYLSRNSLRESSPSGTVVSPIESSVVHKHYGYPHCDNLVLHGPGTCAYCDQYPELQQQRITEKINFTGESDPEKYPCPAEARRDLKKINYWGGNVPLNLHQKALDVLSDTQDINKDTSYEPFNEDLQF